MDNTSSPAADASFFARRGNEPARIGLGRPGLHSAARPRARPLGRGDTARPRDTPPGCGRSPRAAIYSGRRLRSEGEHA